MEWLRVDVETEIDVFALKELAWKKVKTSTWCGNLKTMKFLLKSCGTMIARNESTETDSHLRERHERVATRGKLGQEVK